MELTPCLVDRVQKTFSHNKLLRHATKIHIHYTFVGTSFQSLNLELHISEYMKVVVSLPEMLPDTLCDSEYLAVAFIHTTSDVRGLII